MQLRTLKKQIDEYFAANPYASEAKVIQVVKDSKAMAMDKVIPRFEPMKVELPEDGQYYDDHIKKAEIKVMTDESTFSDPSSDSDEYY